MSYKFLDLGTCAWVKATIPGRCMRVTLKDIHGGTRGQVIKVEDPMQNILPKEYAKRMHAQATNVRHHLMTRSVESPWGDGIRYLPYAALPSLELATRFGIEEFKEQVSLIASKWDGYHAQVLASLEATAANEYKLLDPLGVTDKKIWIADFMETVSKNLITKDEFQEDAGIQIILGTWRPPAQCPSGYYTLSPSAMVSWAEDIVWSRIEPLQKSLMLLRKACEQHEDPKEALAARRDARYILAHYADYLLWDLHHDKALSEHLATAIEFFKGVENALMAPQNSDVRRRLSDLLLPALLLLTPKRVQERVNYLLE